MTQEEINPPTTGPAEVRPDPDPTGEATPEVLASAEQQPAEDGAKPTVVGIGASAGGLAALKTFFSHVPEASGLAFVVVVHLSPEHKSHLAELLQPQVRMPVQQVTETVRLEADQVYVIPPNANLSAIDTHLRLSDLEEKRRERAPIDHFFRTLAQTHDGHAIGVILSGTGSDGTLGLKEIKERGGLAVVQDPVEAEYDGMPQSAIATGLVDLVLPLAEIPAALLRFSQTEPKVTVPAEGQEIDGDERQLLQKVFAQIRARTGRDFSRYKRSTVLRRVSRRMQLAQVEELGDYLDLLRSRPEEVGALADDLLITVTDFFRDPAVFQTLADKVIPSLFAGKGAEDEVRVWVVGCATGEEAYSLAMLLLEAAARLEAPPRLQIFASDLHEPSLAKAREGFYPGDIESHVPDTRLRRFFTKDNGGYRVRKEVRELIVFAPHNLLGDPPFSRLDLISCRNLLIYLQREVQHEVIDLFHYALRPEGYLLLGTSETLEATDLFYPQDKEAHLYRKRNVQAPEPRLPVFPLPRTQLTGGPARGGEPGGEPLAYGALHQQLVERYAPPSVLVSPDEKVVHLSENAGRYLIHPGGELTNHILKLVRPELQIELRAARESRQATRSQPVPVRFNGESGLVSLSVRPAREPEQAGFVLVIFDEQPPGAPAPVAARPVDGQEQTRIGELEAELALTRQRLQAIIEEYETGQEEMKAANEEMQSTNEELRSTMEELETSKEELQSINEELQTVNQENRHKVEELAQLSSDLQNLLTATDIATLFLDRELRIMRFTPKVGDLFNIRLTDRGRPLSDLTHRLGDNALLADGQQVLKDLVPVEREIQAEAGQWYLTRVLPYRSTDDRIEGVVITFVDITGRKLAEEAVRRSEERQAFLLKLSDALRPLTDPAAIEGETCRLLAEYLAAYRAYYVEIRAAEDVAIVRQDYTRGDLPSLAGQYPLSAWGWVFPLYQPGRPVVIADVWQTELVPEPDRERVAAAHVAWMAIPMVKEGELVGALCVAEPKPRAWTTLEVDLAGQTAERIWAAIERGRAEEQLRQAKEYAESIIDTLHEPLLVLTPDLRVQSANPAFYSHFAVNPAETLGQLIYHLGNNQWDIPALRTLLEEVLPENNIFNDFEVTHTFEQIGRRVMLLNARRLDHVQLILLGIRDITRRQQAEEALRRSEARLRQMINVEGVGVLTFSETGTLLEANDAFLQMHGYSRAEVETGTLTWRDFTPAEYVEVSEQQMRQLAQTGRIGPYEKEYLHKDGSRSWMLFAGASLGDGTIVEYCVDVSDRKQAEQALRESERRFREIFETAGVSVWVEDFSQVKQALEALRAQGVADLRAYLAGQPDFTQRMIEQVAVVDVNTETVEMFRAMTKAALLGSLTNVFTPGAEELFREELVALYEGRETLRAETVMRTLDDRPLSVLFTLHFGPPDGDYRRVTVTLTDITTQKQAEAELRQLTAVLEERVAERTAQIQQQMEHLQSLATRLANLREEERQSLSRELHDQIGQQIAALGFNLNFTRQHLSPTSAEAVDKYLVDSMHLIEDTTDRIRNLLAELRPPLLEQDGLIDALEWYAEQVAERTGLEIEVEDMTEQYRLSPAAEIALFRIAQEALTNVTKHAQAGRVRIVLEQDGEDYRLVISDDGRGFEPGRPAQHSPHSPHLGLLSMEERAMSVGGRFRLETEPGRGTRVTVEVPV